MSRSSRLRVLHVGKFYPPHMGGMETHLEALCAGLREEVELEVVVAGDERETTSEVRDGIPVTRIGTVAHLASAPITPGLAGHIRRARPDLLHLHLPHPTAILSLLASGYHGPLVVTYHSDIVRQRVLGAAFAPILHRVLSRSAAIIATSPDYIESSPVLRRHRARCRVIPLGIDPERFETADPSAVAAIRSRFGGRLVLGVGRQVYYKGFEFLIRAMREVDGRLLLVGDGPLREELEQLAERAGVAGRVTFLGEVPDVVPYYHAADVYAFPSIARSEAFGIVQLEAMAAGTPVVNTRLDSGVPFVSPDGLTGLTVPPEDPHALAGAITAILDGEALRARLGAAGRERVRAEFTTQVMVRRTLELYREVAA